MKNKLLTLMLIVSSSFLMNCAKSSDNNNAAAANVCGTSGLVSTINGCLPQGSCPAGYGQATTGQCVAATSGAGIVGSSCGIAGYVQTVSGCLPQGSCPVGQGQAATGQCVQAINSGYGTVGSCLSTDVVVALVNNVQTQLQVGACQPYCAQYGKKYGYANGYCYPSMY